MSSITKEDGKQQKLTGGCAPSGGGKFGAFKSEKSDEFVIDLFDDARQIVKDCVWADDQKITDYDDEGCTEVRFTSSQALKIREWILSQGANAIPRFEVI